MPGRYIVESVRLFHSFNSGNLTNESDKRPQWPILLWLPVRTQRRKSKLETIKPTNPPPTLTASLNPTHAETLPMVPQRVRKRSTARRRAVHALSLGGEAQDGGRPREGLLVVAHAEDRRAERGAELRTDELCGLELVLCWYINCTSLLCVHSELRLR